LQFFDRPYDLDTSQHVLLLASLYKPFTSPLRFTNDRKRLTAIVQTWDLGLDIEGAFE
jgi:hypothetical protein